MRNTRSLMMWVLVLSIIGCLAVWAANPTGNIVQVATKDRDLSTFVKAVNAAGLAGELERPGPFTVFAPTNEAFKKIPSATLASLLKPENKAKLRTILLYHVVKGHYMAADIAKAKAPIMLTTLEGSKIRVTHSGRTVTVGNAKVVKADLMGTNGAIHTIDTVLMPPTRPAK